MIPASSKQKKLIAILTKNDKELKAAFVVQQTQDFTKSSTNDLTHKQANNIIQELGGKPLVYDNWAFFDKNITSQMKIISAAMDYGMTVPHPRYTEICDLGRLSEWLKNQGPVKKPIKKMTPKEISKTIVALESMALKQHLKQ
jgi:hypothetical protein